MGVRNPGRNELLRLEEKTLDAQFLTTIQKGLNCSPFESQKARSPGRKITLRSLPAVSHRSALRRMPRSRLLGILA